MFEEAEVCKYDRVCSFKGITDFIHGCITGYR
jgi:hypothetical protein